ncbi:MAG: ABC transporter permease [Sporichthyaceae bacterium]
MAGNSAAPARGIRAAVPVLEYWVLRYRGAWRSNLLALVLGPVLYLGGLGIGLGALVDRQVGTADLGGVEYLAFLAPGLLAVTAMQLGFDEGAWPVVGALRWWKSYPAMLATPLQTRDIFAGHLLYIAVRLTIAVVIFALAGVLFGAFDSAWVVAAVPAAVLCGLAHAAPSAAYAITRRSEISLAATYRFVILPVSLFSGVFFPISQLPRVLEVLAWFTPLWHGVDLCRDLALGQGHALEAAGHLGYLLAWTAAGFAVGVRTYARRLAP